MSFSPELFRKVDRRIEVINTFLKVSHKIIMLNCRPDESNEYSTFGGFSSLHFRSFDLNFNLGLI